MLATVERGFLFHQHGYIGDISQSSAGDKEGKDSRTEIVNSVSEIGDMVDFLKNYPYVTIDEYKWRINPAMVRVMQYDFTHVNYLSDEEAEMRSARDITNEGLTNDLGVRII